MHGSDRVEYGEIQGVGHFAESDDVDDYRITRPYSETQRLTHWAERAGRRVGPNFTHRPLDAYTTALHHAGFVIESLREPAPPDHLSSVIDDVKRRQMVPSLVHIRARKE